MTELEKKNIREMLSQWAEQMIDENIYPVIAVGLREPDSGMVCRSNDHSPEKIKLLLTTVLRSL